ncbi:cation diffusion facilitator family transporter [Mucilaginibacter ginkgonis]|uniref:Cation transporter n=1 Tax=Mucilaginibacter ginkgonis TaxID=2682091 RepID=A0A6I4I1D1_9SPHI|nr:cation diffusion facilitator family transporter [Mucilaginibacter ginkgonis]QQL51298.1 cation transporter [Mucilaginibacter ginkgonis]
MQQKRTIVLIALAVSVVLMLAKFGAYFITTSNFILTDAAESVVNVLASAFAFFSIYLSSQPRDINHPYGHGKVEFFSVFIEGTLITIAGVTILFKSAYNLFYPHEVHNVVKGAIIIGITGAINGGLGFYMIARGKSLNSITIEADGRHLLTDMVTSGGLVVGLSLMYFLPYLWLDSVLSMGVAIYIVITGYKLIRRSVGGLMDEADFDTVEHIVKIMSDNRKDAWIDVHNLRAQNYGHEVHIDCHLTLPNYFDLIQVHEEVKSVEDLVNRDAGQHVEFFIHTDPCLPKCCHYCNMPNCPIRAEAKRIEIPWNMENTTRNAKHFELDGAV